MYFQGYDVICYIHHMNAACPHNYYIFYEDKVNFVWLGYTLLWNLPQSCASCSMAKVVLQGGESTGNKS